MKNLIKIVLISMLFNHYQVYDDSNPSAYTTQATSSTWSSKEQAHFMEIANIFLRKYMEEVLENGKAYVIRLEQDEGFSKIIYKNN